MICCDRCKKEIEEGREKTIELLDESSVKLNGQEIGPLVSDLRLDASPDRKPVVYLTLKGDVDVNADIPEKTKTKKRRFFIWQR